MAASGNRRAASGAASGEWERGAASRLLNGNSSVGTDRLWLQTSRADRFCQYRGAGLSPGAGTPPEKRSAGKHRAVHVVCMPSEGTARAAQLATFSGHRQHSRRHRRPEVWLTESLRRRAARRRARANARRWPSRPSSERLGQPHFWSPMPPAVLAVTAEGASCAARAVPSEGMQTQRTARRVPADRFPDGVPAPGESPAPRSLQKRSARRSLQHELIQRSPGDPRFSRSESRS